MRFSIKMHTLYPTSGLYIDPEWHSAFFKQKLHDPMKQNVIRFDLRYYDIIVYHITMYGTKNDMVYDMKYD